MVIDEIKGFERKKVVVYNGVKIPEEERKHSDGKIRLVYVGRLEKEKGIMEAVAAVEQLSRDYSVVLDVAGTGTLKAELQAKIQKNEWKNIPENISYEVYRIFQELLSNILRHSEARDIEVCLRLGKNMLQLDFDTDAKVEFPADGRLRQESKGIGLSVIRERVKTIGACLGMKGRHFSLTVPLDNRRRRTK